MKVLYDAEQDDKTFLCTRRIARKEMQGGGGVPLDDTGA